MEGRPEPPKCPRCLSSPKWHFAAIARHADEDGGALGPVISAVHCAVCFCGTWTWRQGAWVDPRGRLA